MDTEIISEPIPMSELAAMASPEFFNAVKAVVDIEREVMAVGGELHADQEVLLLDQGSAQNDLWGINLYPGKTGGEFIEYDSMINLRPSFGNRSRGIDDPETRRRVADVVHRLVKADE
ncbi:MAG: DUF5674 family protein [Planctomycetota bacterium]